MVLYWPLKGPFMARKPLRIRDADLSQALRLALRRGAFAPAEASRVIRALEGCSQDEFANRLGLNRKVIRALESGQGNLRYDSLEKIASSAGLRLAFVSPSGAVKLMDPDARAQDEREQREADARALASGKLTERALEERNALRVEDVSFALRKLT
jgi:transcriptional regulator with XRE-family HTH domain